MKWIKKILLALFAFVILILVVALFLPKEMNAESEITINKPKQEVFDYIKYVKNQDNFGKWQLSEPDLKKSYEGTDGTVGFKYSWDGKKLGKGSQQITHIVDGERVDSEMRFSFGDPAQAYFITEDLGNRQTKVKWGIKGKSMYPFNLMNLFYDMNQDFEEGLTNLKAVLEKN